MKKFMIITGEINYPTDFNFITELDIQIYVAANNLKIRDITPPGDFHKIHAIIEFKERCRENELYRSQLRYRDMEWGCIYALAGLFGHGDHWHRGSLQIEDIIYYFHLNDDNVKY